ncbi:uncharacterized protein LOC119726986 [Patiria miniata]|uniref:Uncharacterized protein n=1 Tax=Patiria miniata TaxID=46514 RepID=A0A913ZU73_PATMI|nr:uncharacterized protein LOC119726986 [Patiria miniata]
MKMFHPVSIGLQFHHVFENEKAIACNLLKAPKLEWLPNPEEDMVMELELQEEEEQDEEIEEEDLKSDVDYVPSSDSDDSPWEMDSTVETTDVVDERKFLIF